MVKLGPEISKVGPSEYPLFRCAGPAGTIYFHVLVLQSIIPFFPSIFSIHPDSIRAVLSLSSGHLSSSTSTSYRILTNLPPSVYHPLNVLAGTDSTLYNRLHYLPEWYITRYGWFAALLQYVPTGLLGDVTQYAQHAEGTMYIRGPETDTKL
jgi:hypothetical protein